MIRDSDRAAALLELTLVTPLLLFMIFACYLLAKRTKDADQTQAIITHLGRVITSECANQSKTITNLDCLTATIQGTLAQSVLSELPPDTAITAVSFAYQGGAVKIIDSYPASLSTSTQMPTSTLLNLANLVALKPGCNPCKMPLNSSACQQLTQSEFYALTKIQALNDKKPIINLAQISRAKAGSTIACDGNLNFIPASNTLIDYEHVSTTIF